MNRSLRVSATRFLSIALIALWPLASLCAQVEQGAGRPNILWLVAEMDGYVGVILRQLEEDGLLENTIVVWYSDHGGPLARQKRLLYDSGLHVPLIKRLSRGCVPP